MQTYITGYPWPVTAPLGLYPEYPLDCLPHVEYELRKAITEALFRSAATISLQHACVMLLSTHVAHDDVVPVVCVLCCSLCCLC